MGIIIGILILRPLKGGALLIMGLHKGFKAERLQIPGVCLGFRVSGLGFSNAFVLMDKEFHDSCLNLPSPKKSPVHPSSDKYSQKGTVIYRHMTGENICHYHSGMKISSRLNLKALTLNALEPWVLSHPVTVYIRGPIKGYI